MSKKDELLGKSKSEPQEYDFTNEEKKELGALLNLIEQARIAQDLLYTGIVQGVAQRLKVNDKSIEVNMTEVLQSGVEKARLMVK